MAEGNFHSLIRPLHTDTIREIQSTLLLLQAGVLVLLLIDAVNLTNLLLVRTSGRSRELAVRQALGARQGYLARDAWLETTLITFGGGALGMGIGAAGVRLLTTLGADQLPLGATISFDTRVVGIALAATLVLGGLLAFAPSWLMHRISINCQLQSETAGGTPGGASQRLRQTFGMVQIALAFVLLCAAGLLGVSLNRALAQPVGFTPNNILVGELWLPWKGYPSGMHQPVFVNRLQQALMSEPGVLQISVNNSLPFGGFVNGRPIAVEDNGNNTSTNVRTHHHSGVTSGYWQVIGISFLRGRLPGNEVFAPDAQQVCVIDQAMADA
ncbi:MAG: FtsX-like permease family protein [Candidatus Synoicihabitans palmerolidicus]|nr:FtsX-like permease family protein [Candidatus Synoicihabitans palmerolidicus]